MRQFFSTAIEERIQKINSESDAETPCLSDSMIKANIIDAKLMLKDAIINHVINFHVTTTTSTPPTLNVLLFLLASHPEKQKKLQEELDANFDRDNLDAQLINFELINKCQYLDAVVKEGLRIHPISASIGRRITKETKILEYSIPVGCEIIFDFNSLFKHPGAHFL